MDGEIFYHHSIFCNRCICGLDDDDENENPWVPTLEELDQQNLDQIRDALAADYKDLAS